MADDLSFIQGAISETQDRGRIDDYVKWASEQAALIRAGRFDQVDILNVAEEIEDVGKSEIRAFESHLEIVLMHMLTWEYQPTRRSRSWDRSMFSNRYRIRRLLQANPSLGGRRNEFVETAYEFSRRLAARHTRPDISTYPEVCPFNWQQIMKTPYEFGQS